MALTTPSHLTPRLKKEYSYTSTPTLGLRSLCTLSLFIACPLQQWLHESASLYVQSLWCFTGPKPGDSQTQTAEQTDRYSNELKELTARTATQGVCVLSRHCLVTA